MYGSLLLPLLFKSKLTYHKWNIYNQKDYIYNISFGFILFLDSWKGIAESYTNSNI